MSYQTSADLRQTSRVAIRAIMLSRTFALSMLACTAACGGGSKGAATTTPTSTAATQPGMNAGVDPTLNGALASDAAGDGSAGSGVLDLGGPVIEPPNLDTDPVKAKSSVDEHLRISKASLGSRPPDTDTALREAKAALDIDASSVDAGAMVALVYYHKRLYDTAEVILDDMFKRQAAKENANVSYVYGLIYEKQGKPAEALLAFKTAVQLNPAHQSAKINLGVYQLRNKQYTEAIATYESVAKAGRNDVEVWNSLGAGYRGHSADYPAGSNERNGLIKQAESSFRKASGGGGNAAAYYNLVLLYLDADPYPAEGGSMDTLARLEKSRAYFDEYRNMPGAESTLYDERAKDVGKLIKREEKKRKKGLKGNP
jgi:tetratricopeptide (TPR) repeat protein